MPNFDDVDLAIIVIGLLGLFSVILILVFEDQFTITGLGSAMAPFITAIGSLARGKPRNGN